MKTQFLDQENRDNPMNGQTISGPSELRDLLRSARDRRPFFGELIGDNGLKILLGLGADWGCVQFSGANGELPYLVAIGPEPDAEGEMSFLAGGTLTPVPRRYLLPSETMFSIAETFVSTGMRSAIVDWEEI